MEIRLTSEEVAALGDLLEGYFRELTSEISHTDNPAFRRRLREHRDVLRGIQERLKSAGDSAVLAG